MMRRNGILLMYRTLASGVALCLLAGCSDFRQKLGLDPEAPDEFTVYDRAPLEVPPQFNLRPPRPGEARPQEATAAQSAQKVLFHGTPPAAQMAVHSPGKAELLKHAGIEKKQDDIRRKLDEDLSLETKSDPNMVKDLLSWQKKHPKTDVIDPYKEQQRLEEQLNDSSAERVQ